METLSVGLIRLWPGYRPAQCNPRIQVTGARKLRLARPVLTPLVQPLLQSGGQIDGVRLESGRSPQGRAEQCDGKARAIVILFVAKLSEQRAFQNARSISLTIAYPGKGTVATRAEIAARIHFPLRH
jgi:hypothetical protein